MTDRETTAPPPTGTLPAQPPWQAAQSAPVPPPRAPEPPAQAPWLRNQPQAPAAQPSTPPPHWAPQQPPGDAPTLVQPAPGAAFPPPGQGGPLPPSAPQPPRRGSGNLLWAALGALLAAALLAGAVLFGDDLLNGSEASDSNRASTSVAPQEDGPVAEDESVPDLPTLGEEPDPATEPLPSEPNVVNGDLGLSVPMMSPACDGSWVVFLGAATDPAAYEFDVQTLLESNPGAQYTLTQGSCASMRQALPNGDLIYAVWTGPYADQSAACAARAGYGDAAYVKRMDDTTPPEQLWEC